MSMKEKTGHGRILRSSSIVGAASIIRVGLGIIRIKLLALIVGVSGIGLLGLLTSSMTTGAILAGCGLQESSVRELSGITDDEQAAHHVRKTMWILGLFLGLVGTLTMYLFRFPISYAVFNTYENSTDILWISLGLFFVVVSTVPIAIHQAYRRIQIIAKIQIYGGFIGVVTSVLIIYVWGVDAIALSVVAIPFGILLCALVLRAPKVVQAKTTKHSRTLPETSKKILGFGFLLMLGAIIATGADLAVRSFVANELGLEAAGHFYAALQLSTAYLSLILAAMATDYYPRLIQIISRNEDLPKVVSEQTEIALLLAGPIIILAIAVAPWIVRIMYTASFAPTVEIFRWQVLADSIKIITWPISLVFVARGQGLLFLILQIVSYSFYVFLNVFGIPLIGLTATGVAFFGMYLLYLPIISVLGRRTIGFRWTPEIVKNSSLLVAAATFLLALSYWSDLVTAIAGIVIALVFLSFSLRRLDSMKVGGRIGHLISAIRKVSRV